MKKWKQFNKQKKRDFWHARFKFNKKEFYPVAETKIALEELIDEIRSQERREVENSKYKLNREVIYLIPTVADLLEEVRPNIRKEHQRTLTKRVFENFNKVIPAELKVNELKTFHFDSYIRHRQTLISKITHKPVTLTTIYKELYAISGALKDGAKSYEGLTEWQPPKLPTLPKGYKKKSKRERIVTEAEFLAIINELSKPPHERVTALHCIHRHQLAHILEFSYRTGLRRKEITALKFSQFNKGKSALLNVKRYKTDSITPELPIDEKAIEIINLRRNIQGDSIYIFTKDGKPPAAAYRTLREVCKKLNITYGRYTDGGFIPHDFRHTFATELIANTDIKTAQVLLGHSNISQTADYLHTNVERMREALRKREKINYDSKLEEIFEAVKKEKIDLSNFVEKVKNLFGFSS